MPEINGITLMMAIQAVEFKMNDIERSLQDETCANGAELESLLLSYDKAATALRVGYEDAVKLSSNLPPYETLVGQGDGRAG